VDSASIDYLHASPQIATGGFKEAGVLAVIGSKESIDVVEDDVVEDKEKADS
jgi:hypothetical protein